MPEDTNVLMGLDIVEDWLRDQFPGAEIEPLGQKRDMPRYRWIVHRGAGKKAFRLATTVNALGSPSLLLQKLYELESGTWLKDIDEKENCLVLNKVGITAARPGEW